MFSSFSSTLTYLIVQKNVKKAWTFFEIDFGIDVLKLIKINSILRPVYF